MQPLLYGELLPELPGSDFEEGGAESPGGDPLPDGFFRRGKCRGATKKFQGHLRNPQAALSRRFTGAGQVTIGWAGRLALFAFAGLLLATLLLLAGSFRLLGRLFFRHGQTSFIQPPGCNRHPSPQRMNHPGASSLAP
jgi:hypothetical protein